MRLQQEMQRLQADIQLRLSGSRPNFRPIEAPQQQQTTAAPQQSPPEPSPLPPVEDNQVKRTKVEEDFVLPCTMSSGEEGLCRPLVNCLAFYTDLPALRKEPCPLRREEQGVCCPRNAKRPIGGGPQSSGVIQPPPPPQVQVPPLTPQQLNKAGEEALQTIQTKINFVHNLFLNRVFVSADSPAVGHQAFFPTSNETLAVGSQAEKGIAASTALVKEFNLTPDQGTFALPRFSLLNTILADSCPRRGQCFPSKYRSYDGSCNNLRNPEWGAVGTALQRILPPKYADGVNAPRSTDSRGRPLPSARLVSMTYASDSDHSSDNYTMMTMQWGQFLDHDLTHTPISRGESGAGITCCNNGVERPPNFRHPDCFPIMLPRIDPVFSPFGERCMEFARSLPAPRPECNFGPREQMNQITGYLDGSNIYGSNVNSANALRLFRGGQLRTQNVKGRPYLPDNPGECTDQTNTLACFSAGDGRVNEQVDLALMHTIWMREHNRVARVLQQLHPRWSDEALYQEARRIVVAEMQHVTYNEFLPILLGRDYTDRSGLTPREKGWTRLYDEKLRGGITNVFATAAFRYGHSQIQSFIHGYGMFGNLKESLEMSKQHFAPFMLYEDGAVDDMIRGLTAQASQEIDRFFSNQIRDHLFQGNLDIGLDLIALNIQRGRDHGLPPYNDWREVCGLPRARTWNDLEAQMDPSTISILSRLYSNPDEIDLFPGAVGERRKEGAMFGPTLICLVGDQFARLRRSDRFFYEEANQPSTFSERQLTEIKRTSLARILCDNSDDIQLIQPLVFVQPSFLNQRVTCASSAIPFVDLRAWANEKPAV
uniref:Chorion peroxidase n=1 Tax=Lygus hesperus TaxID=30085 RepID=A0A0A9Z8J0_LYGHE